MLQKHIHPVYFITISCVGFMVGVYCARFSVPVVISWLAFLFIFGLVFVRQFRLISLCASLCVVLGLVRGADYYNVLAGYAKYEGKSLRVMGYVASDPSSGKNSSQKVTLTRLHIFDLPTEGTLAISLPDSVVIRRGDIVRAEGVAQLQYGNKMLIITEPHDVFIGKGNDVIIAVRDAFGESVRKNVNEPQASLGLGFLTGQKSALPSGLMESIQILGLSHIIVASGYNLTVIIDFIRPKLHRISRFSATSGALIAVWLFSFVTGFGPSMVRASLVATLSLLTWYYGLKIKPFVLIVVTACATVIYNPGYLNGDLGWLLSYLSFAGVLMVAPLLHSFFNVHGAKPGLIGNLVGETLSAMVMTLPLTMHTFGTVSPLVIVANLVIVPFIPLAMIATFAAGLVGFMPDWLSFISWPAEFIMGLMVKVVDYLSVLPFAQLRIELSSGMMIAAYVVIGCFVGGIAYLNKRRIQKSFIEVY